jgi:hypothetical protein
MAKGIRTARGERIPVRRLNAQLWHRRSRATWENDDPHSGYRHLADKDALSSAPDLDVCSRDTFRGAAPILGHVGRWLDSLPLGL